MSATEPTRPSAPYTTISLKRLHESKYWDDPQNEWLPRRASLEVQIGPSLGFSRVWREVHLNLQSGPEFLYRYFPFASFVYVGDRVETIVEFDGPFEERRATIRVPVGVPVQVIIVTELAGIPSTGGHGSDSRELALRFAGLTLGEGLAQPPSISTSTPREHYELSVLSPEEAEPRPVFVVGAYRSGTSVLTWALGQHPNFWPMEETGWIPPLADAAILGYRNAATAARGFFDVYDVGKREYYAHFGRAIDRFCRDISRRYSHGVLLGRLSGKDQDYNAEYQLSRSVMNPKRRWVDGTPENSGYMASLRAVFPSARFIALVRNPLDVVVSMLRFERAGGETRGVKGAADMWLGIMRMVLLGYRAFGPEVVQLVSYDTLGNDVGRTLRELFDFLGEPNFPKASETFAKRINSSQISHEERTALYREIDAEPEIKAKLLALHGELLGEIGKPWERDASAVHELRAIENDRIMRMALEYRGGIPLPMADE